MAKDLTTSAIERQNVLNNNLAIPRIQEALVGTGDEVNPESWTQLKGSHEA